jgi:hypothetical protein
MNFKNIFAVSCLICLFACSNDCLIDKVSGDAEVQVSHLLKEISEVRKSENPNRALLVSPRTLDYDGNLELVASRDWTSGFFPGVLWYLYENTGKEEWLNSAKEFTLNIEPEKQNTTTHDVGFKIYCSFGNGYHLTDDKHFREVIIEAAHSLSKRFNPATGCILSWDHSRDKYAHPVIIDNMMNLELLFAASRLTGDPSFYEIAVSHANTTMKNHFRPDFGTYHVIDYDSITGAVLQKKTHQGYSDESTWSRGQAWALYGYTFCYRETKDMKYLKQAENIASFILNHPRLPEDLVPYWDFDAPEIPNEPRDVSAACVIASALYELSCYSENKEWYQQSANKIVANLTQNYRAKKGDARGFLLLHSTGSKPSNKEVDVPLIYADYYYLEALLRAEKLHEGKPVVFAKL